MAELINLDKLPKGVKDLVKPYVQRLIEILGKNVCSIAVFGSATGDDFIPKKSNVNLLVVCERVELSELKKCFKLIAQGRKKGIVTPLFLTKRHMETSADVFPIEFLDMSDFHQVIYGKPVFDEFEFGTENLRLECEEQLKGKLIRLRQVYLEVGTNPKSISAVLVESLTSLIPVFRGMLRLLGKEVPKLKRDVIEAVGKEFVVDASIFSYILRLKAGKVKLDKKRVEDLFGKYIKEIEKLAVEVDRFCKSDKAI